MFLFNNFDLNFIKDCMSNIFEYIFDNFYSFSLFLYYLWQGFDFFSFFVFFYLFILFIYFIFLIILFFDFLKDLLPKIGLNYIIYFFAFIVFFIFSILNFFFFGNIGVLFTIYVNLLYRIRRHLFNHIPRHWINITPDIFSGKQFTFLTKIWPSFFAKEFPRLAKYYLEIFIKIQRRKRLGFWNVFTARPSYLTTTGIRFFFASNPIDFRKHTYFSAAILDFLHYAHLFFIKNLRFFYVFNLLYWTLRRFFYFKYLCFIRIFPRNLKLFSLSVFYYLTHGSNFLYFLYVILVSSCFKFWYHPLGFLLRKSFFKLFDFWFFYYFANRGRNLFSRHIFYDKEHYQPNDIKPRVRIFSYFFNPEYFLHWSKIFFDTRVVVTYSQFQRYIFIVYRVLFFIFFPFYFILSKFLILIFVYVVKWTSLSNLKLVILRYLGKLIFICLNTLLFVDKYLKHFFNFLLFFIYFFHNLIKLIFFNFFYYSGKFFVSIYLLLKHILELCFSLIYSLIFGLYIIIRILWYIKSLLFFIIALFVFFYYFLYTIFLYLTLDTTLSPTVIIFYDFLNYVLELWNFFLPVLVFFFDYLPSLFFPELMAYFWIILLWIVELFLHLIFQFFELALLFWFKIIEVILTSLHYIYCFCFGIYNNYLVISDSDSFFILRVFKRFFLINYSRFVGWLYLTIDFIKTSLISFISFIYIFCLKVFEIILDWVFKYFSFLVTFFSTVILCFFEELLRFILNFFILGYFLLLNFLFFLLKPVMGWVVYLKILHYYFIFISILYVWLKDWLFFFLVNINTGIVYLLTCLSVGFLEFWFYTYAFLKMSICFCWIFLYNIFLFFFKVDLIYSLLFNVFLPFVWFHFIFVFEYLLIVFLYVICVFELFIHIIYRQLSLFYFWFCSLSFILWFRVNIVFFSLVITYLKDMLYDYDGLKIFNEFFFLFKSYDFVFSCYDYWVWSGETYLKVHIKHLKAILLEINIFFYLYSILIFLNNLFLFFISKFLFYLFLIFNFVLKYFAFFIYPLISFLFVILIHTNTFFWYTDCYFFFCQFYYASDLIFLLHCFVADVYHVLFLYLIENSFFVYFFSLCSFVTQFDMSNWRASILLAILCVNDALAFWSYASPDVDFNVDLNKYYEELDFHHTNAYYDYRAFFQQHEGPNLNVIPEVDWLLPRNLHDNFYKNIYYYKYIWDRLPENLSIYKFIEDGLKSPEVTYTRDVQVQLDKYEDHGPSFFDYVYLYDYVKLMINNQKSFWDWRTQVNFSWRCKIAAWRWSTYNKVRLNINHWIIFHFNHYDIGALFGLGRPKVKHYKYTEWMRLFKNYRALRNLNLLVDFYHTGSRFYYDRWVWNTYLEAMGHRFNKPIVLKTLAVWNFITRPLFAYKTYSDYRAYKELYPNQIPDKIAVAYYLTTADIFYQYLTYNIYGASWKQSFDSYLLNGSFDLNYFYPYYPFHDHTMTYPFAVTTTFHYRISPLKPYTILLCEDVYKWLKRRYERETVSKYHEYLEYVWKYVFVRRYLRGPLGAFIGSGNMTFGLRVLPVPEKHPYNTHFWGNVPYTHMRHFFFQYILRDRLDLYYDDYYADSWFNRPAKGDLFTIIPDGFFKILNTHPSRRNICTRDLITSDPTIFHYANEFRSFWLDGRLFSRYIWSLSTLVPNFFDFRRGAHLQHNLNYIFGSTTDDYFGFIYSNEFFRAMYKFKQSLNFFTLYRTPFVLSNDGILNYNFDRNIVFPRNHFYVINYYQNFLITDRNSIDVPFSSFFSLGSLYKRELLSKTMHYFRNYYLRWGVFFHRHVVEHRYYVAKRHVMYLYAWGIPKPLRVDLLFYNPKHGFHFRPFVRMKWKVYLQEAIPYSHKFTSRILFKSVKDYKPFYFHYYRPVPRLTRFTDFYTRGHYDLEDSYLFRLQRRFDYEFVYYKKIPRVFRRFYRRRRRYMWYYDRRVVALFDLFYHSWMGSSRFFRSNFALYPAYNDLSYLNLDNWTYPEYGLVYMKKTNLPEFWELSSYPIYPRYYRRLTWATEGFRGGYLSYIDSLTYFHNMGNINAITPYLFSWLFHFRKGVFYYDTTFIDQPTRYVMAFSIIWVFLYFFSSGFRNFFFPELDIKNNSDFLWKRLRSLRPTGNVYHTWREYSLFYNEVSDIPNNYIIENYQTFKPHPNNVYAFDFQFSGVEPSHYYAYTELEDRVAYLMYRFIPFYSTWPFLTASMQSDTRRLYSYYDLLINPRFNNYYNLVYSESPNRFQVLPYVTILGKYFNSSILEIFWNDGFTHIHDVQLNLETMIRYEYFQREEEDENTFILHYYQESEPGEYFRFDWPRALVPFYYDVIGRQQWLTRISDFFFSIDKIFDFELPNWAYHKDFNMLPYIKDSSDQYRIVDNVDFSFEHLNFYLFYLPMMFFLIYSGATARTSQYYDFSHTYFLLLSSFRFLVPFIDVWDNLIWLDNYVWDNTAANMPNGTSYYLYLSDQFIWSQAPIFADFYDHSWNSPYWAHSEILQRLNHLHVDSFIYEPKCIIDPFYFFYSLMFFLTLLKSVLNAPTYIQAFITKENFSLISKYWRLNDIYKKLFKYYGKNP